VQLGYHLDGIMIANEEYGLCYSQIEVADTDVFEQEFGPGGTYQEEFEKAVCWTQQEDSEEGK
jgi:hypothetical protein